MGDIEGPVRSKRQPRTEQEKKMQQLWAQILDVKADIIGLDDSFVSLGGDSFAGMNLVAEAQNSGFQLELEDLFSTPVLGDLVEQTKYSLTASPSVIPRVSHPGPITPQSYAQGRLWFL